MRRQIWRWLDEGFGGSRFGFWLNAVIVVFIVSSVVAVIAETHKGLWLSHGEAFRLFEIVAVAVFTVEYLVRIWVCVENPRYAKYSPGIARLRYAFSPVALIDFIAVAPFYLSLFVAVDLRYLRMFRLIRLLKLSHYFAGVSLFLRVIKTELASLGAALFIILVLIIMSAILMYYLESDAQPEVFRSIADSVWWAVVTLTTVGYGDVTPATWGGRILAIAIMLLGVATVAIPAGLLAARFTEELHRRRDELKAGVVDAMSDGTLDDEELAALEKLRVEMGLPEEDIERLVQHQKQLAKRLRVCPHCGKDVSR